MKRDERHNDNKQQSAREIAWDAVLLVVLLVASLKFTCGIEQAFDIQLWDESNHMYGGLSIHAIRTGSLADIKLPGAQDGPLYSCGYFLLSLFRSDPLKLYDLAARSLCVLVTLLIFVTMRRLGDSQIAALLVSFWYLVSHASISMVPRSGNAALLIVLASLTAASFAKTVVTRYALMAVGALMASYARPELYYSYVAFCIIVVTGILRRPVRDTILQNRWKLSLLAGATVISLAMIPQSGLPVSGNRSWAAFSQHFGINFAQWQGTSHAATGLDYETIIGTVFGNASTVTQAFLMNPAELLRHVWTNLQQAPASVGAVLSTDWRWLTIAGFIALPGVLVVSRVVGRESIRQLLQRVHRDSFPLWVAVVILVPALISASLVYPWPRYLLVPVVIGLVTIFHYLGNIGRPDRPIMSIGLSVILFIVTPSYCSGWTWYGTPLLFDAPERPNLPNRATIDFLRALNIRSRVTVYSADGLYHLYAGPNFRQVPWREKSQEESFTDFIKRREINLIVVSDLLLSSERLGSSSVKEFIHRAEERGFEAKEAPGSGRTILIGKGLLQQLHTNSHPRNGFTFNARESPMPMRPGRAVH